MTNTVSAINALKAKKNKKGFTLMEMLIVVAIIAILVAIAIPVFNTQLNNARAQVDAANLRSASSMAVTQYLSSAATSATTYYFTEDSGSNFTIGAKPTVGYNQAEEGGVAAKNAFIQVVVTDGKADATWVSVK